MAEDKIDFDLPAKVEALLYKHALDALTPDEAKHTEIIRDHTGKIVGARRGDKTLRVIRDANNRPVRIEHHNP